MGTLTVIMITAIAIASGILLTYPFTERIPLSARLCAGSVIGLAGLSWISFLLSLALGLYAAAILLTAGVLAGALIALLRLVTIKRLRADFGSIEFNLAGSIYYAVWAALLAWIFGGVMMFYPDGMHTAPANNYGDLPFHLGAITSFAYGENLPPQSPIFAGLKFTYPFLIDFLTAFFIRCGADWRTAFFIENIVLSLALVGLIDALTLRITGNKLAARLAPVIFLFNGGLGFLNFFQDLGRFLKDPNQAKYGLVFFFEHLPKTYTMNTELNEIPLRWGNVFTTLLIPQRSMLFGLPIVAMIIALWWMAVGNAECGMRNAECGTREGGSFLITLRSIFAIPHSAFRIPHSAFLAAGLLAGILPMLHTHGFFAVMIASVPVFLLYPSWKWIAFYLPVAVLAAPQVLWLSGTPVRNSLFNFELWREAGNASLPVFWTANAGVYLVLLIAALLSYKPVAPHLKRFYLPFLLWFLVPNLMTLAPWSWDNIKVLIYWSLASVPLVAVMLAYLFRRRFTAPLGGLLLIALTLSGFLDVWRGLSPVENTRLFAVDELETAALLREKTSPRSLILDVPIHNSIVTLSGRQSFMGYPGHLWSHGIDYRSRERDVVEIFRGGENAAELIARSKIDYMIIGPPGRSQVAVNENYFSSRYPLVIEHGRYRVYRVTEVADRILK
ncbi:MAG: hypothetical protein J2P41_09020 [Blastocatellia bacterium]|nr:hypothetical protein [Blastocatellia bacterium]